MSQQNKIGNTINSYFIVLTGGGAVGGIVGLTYWLYKVAINERTFNWPTLIAILVVILVSAAISYMLFRMIDEESEYHSERRTRN
ncbi:hypothetical protein [Fulvivirga imtechensis]|uniref:hypothetical protein n=1 Tax=Fulvivirga imtechensis TaxID=881893 RepID=UPI00058E90F3|nr:hypothetical protein [Fulvivirga imtechensis]